MIRSVREDIWLEHILRVSESCETKFNMKSLNTKGGQKERSR